MRIHTRIAATATCIVAIPLLAACTEMTTTVPSRPVSSAPSTAAASTPAATASTPATLAPELLALAPAYEDLAKGFLTKHATQPIHATWADPNDATYEYMWNPDGSYQISKTTPDKKTQTLRCPSINPAASCEKQTENGPWETFTAPTLATEWPAGGAATGPSYVLARAFALADCTTEDGTTRTGTSETGDTITLTSQSEFKHGTFQDGNPTDGYRTRTTFKFTPDTITIHSQMDKPNGTPERQVNVTVGAAAT